MASFIHDSFKTLLMSGHIDLGSDSIFVTLVSGGHTPSATTRPTYTDISGFIVTGAGYSNKVITNPSVTVDAGVAKFSTPDTVSWTSSTITASGAYLWRSGAAGPVTHPVVGYIDFGSNKSSSNGDFTINFSAEGIIKIQNGS